MDLECPYCETGLDVCHDDGFGYEEGVKHQMECSNCEKTFVFETSISFYYAPEKADCLNKGEHEWKPARAFPLEYTRMECKSCGGTRQPTESEMKEILSETVS